MKLVFEKLSSTLLVTLLSIVVISCSLSEKDNINELSDNGSRGIGSSITEEFFSLGYRHPLDPEKDYLYNRPKTVEVKDAEGNVLDTISDFHMRMLVKARQGYLFDRTMVELINPEKEHDPRFRLVDESSTPWGIGDTGDAIVPWKSIAADPYVLTLGSEVYIKEFDGLLLPDGNIHDGRFKVITSMPLAGYHVELYTGSYENTFEMKKILEDNIDITIVGEIAKRANKTIKVSTSDKGNFYPSGDVKVLVGQDRAFFVKPKSGYYVDKVFLNGEPVSYRNYDGKYIMRSVVNDSVLEASYITEEDYFKKKSYSITTEAVNGSIVESFTVKEGEEPEITYTPNEGYQINEVIIDGRPVPYPWFYKEQYIFKPVRSNSSIKVVFSLIPCKFLTREFKIVQDWGTGFSAKLTLTNPTEEPIYWDSCWPKYSLGTWFNYCNLRISQRHKLLVIYSSDWNRVILPGQTLTIHLNSAWPLDPDMKVPEFHIRLGW